MKDKNNIVKRTTKASFLAEVKHIVEQGRQQAYASYLGEYRELSHTC